MYSDEYTDREVEHEWAVACMKMYTELKGTKIPDDVIGNMLLIYFQHLLSIAEIVEG